MADVAHVEVDAEANLELVRQARYPQHANDSVSWMATGP
jgi:hypothetical protein